MTRIINGLLLIALMVGAFLAIRADAERRELQTEYDRLVLEHGYLPIEDPDKIHIVALETEDPLHFRWRIYLPANHAFQWKHRNGHSYGSANKEPKNFIAQVRFRFEADRGLQVFHSHQSGSGRGNTYRGKAAQFMKDHWDELKITYIGKDRVESFDIDRVIDAVRIEMPDELFVEFEKQCPLDAKYRGATVFYRELGTKEAFAKRKSQPNKGKAGQ